MEGLQRDCRLSFRCSIFALLILTQELCAATLAQAATEPELRTLADQAAVWARTTRTRLLAAEGRLTALNADPASPLAEIAAEVRRVDGLSRELGEIRGLIGHVGTIRPRVAGWQQKAAFRAGC